MFERATMPGVSTTSLLSQIARTDRFTRGVPTRFTVTGNGATVLFLRTSAGDDPVSRLWALDLDTGTERVLADPAGLIDEPGTGITGYATDPAGRLIAFVLADELWAVQDGQARRLPNPASPRDPRPDPTGSLIACLAGGELRLVNADGTHDRALASPDGPDVTFGVARHTDATSISDAARGFWWAPDGRRLLAARTDDSNVRLWHLTDPTRPTQPPRTLRYPAVGTANPDVTLWIVALDGTRTQVGWDRQAFEYLVGAGWDEHGPHALVQSRNQQVVRFLAVDPATGQTSVLHEQRDDRWVQLLPGLPARTASGALVTHVDDGDTRRLAIGGTVVTPPGLLVRAVLDVTGEDVLFTASDDPTVTHLCRYRPDAGVQWLTDDAAVHDGVRGSGTLVRISEGPDRPGGRFSVLREGNETPIRSVVEDPVLRLTVRDLVLGPRALRARLYLPSWYTPAYGRLPIIADPYGGAGAQKVTAALVGPDLISQWFAEHGFAVLVTDGAGTPGRGPVWEREVYGDLFGPVCDDQVMAVREVARLFPELDADRVGIRGWSFGGSLAEFAILTRPDVFHAAVAGAGVTDQTLYDTHWRERFLGQPDVFPQHYEHNSLVRLAPRLTRPLLLIHGLDDDNVHPANTLLLAQALLAAGRPHELVLLPGVGHQLFASPMAADVLRRQLAFFRRHLG